MPGRGRPATPTEVKRLRSGDGRRTAGNRLLPKGTVTLRGAIDPPDPPDDLREPGKELWHRAWGEAIVWLSPESDLAAVERACRLVDAYRIASDEYMDTKDWRAGGLLVKLSKELGSALAELGFSPVSRTRMGVAEVKRVSKIEELRRRHDEERAGPVTIDGDFLG